TFWKPEISAILSHARMKRSWTSMQESIRMACGGDCRKSKLLTGCNPCICAVAGCCSGGYCRANHDKHQAGMNLSANPLMQWRLPVGLGPSLKICPKCPP